MVTGNNRNAAVCSISLLPQRQRGAETEKLKKIRQMEGEKYRTKRTK